MILKTLVFRYVSFAIIATAVNLAMQRIVLMNGSSAVFFAIAVAVGTMSGLIVKYLLDKRWIFNDIESGARAHGRKFALYTAMGLITTVIFWGSETIFWVIWRTDLMRETGAILGLTVGYMIKYRLDRRFVFTNSALAQST